MKDWMRVGRVVKSQGVKGELKISLDVDDDTGFVECKILKIGAAEYEVESVKCLVNGVFVKLKGVSDRNAADLLRGSTVEVSGDNQPKLPKGRYYIVDLIGCKIYVGGKEFGELTDILQNGSADVYVVKGSGNHNNFMFPALKSVLEKVDVENKIIELNAEKLKEIAVYED